MRDPEIDPGSRLDIDRLVRRVLWDAGFREPPVDVAVVLRALDLDLNFYDLEDPGLVQRLRHRILIGARRLADFVEKVNLKALLFFDDKRVLLDKALPQLKHDWASAHEAGHQIIPWHREFCRGDTELTLDPAWQDLMEAEANYAASALLFCGEQFTIDARDTKPSIASVQSLQQRYRKNLLPTARRYIRHGPDHPMILLVSTARWDEKPPDQPARVRHLIVSPSFEERFVVPDPESLRREIDARARRRRGGPVGGFELQLPDRNAEVHVFHAECFYNRYYLITLLVHRGRAADAVLLTTQAVSA